MLDRLKIVSLTANTDMAIEIAKTLGVEVLPTELTHFADGEILFTGKKSFRGDNVYIIQSTCAPVTERLMELLICIDACKRASAKTITCVIPYFGYARQDRKAKPRQPITAKLVADMLTAAGADRIVSTDLHASQITGFFNIPVDDVSPMVLFYRYFKDLKIKDDIICVSPDHGGLVRTSRLAEKLNAPLAIIDKRRPKPNVAVAMNLIGDVQGKVAIIIDDMVDTGGTIASGVQMLKDHGATKVFVTCSHAILSGPAVERLRATGLEEFVCTNTIDQTEHQKEFPEMKVLSVAPLLARLISAVENNTSLSAALNKPFMHE